MSLRTFLSTSKSQSLFSGLLFKFALWTIETRYPNYLSQSLFSGLLFKCSIVQSSWSELLGCNPFFQVFFLNSGNNPESIRRFLRLNPFFQVFFLNPANYDARLSVDERVSIPFFRSSF